MSILVTGGAGYIGSHMVLRLTDAGEDVVVFDNLSTGHLRLVSDKAKFVKGDLHDEEAVAACIRDHGVTDIMHFAGVIVVPESVADPLKYYDQNTAVSRSLIDVAVACGVERFIFSSTAAVYGAVEQGPVTEDHATDPLSPYGRSKLMTEWMLQDTAHAHPFRYGACRYFNVAGADPQGRSGHCSGEATHLIKVACKAALGQRDDVAIFGTDFDTPDGTGVRDYIHVWDLVDAHALLLDHLRDGGESITMNCGYGVGSSVREVIEMVQAISGKNFKVIEGDRRAGDPASVVADASRLRATLPWTPKHADLKEMVGSAYRWELKLIKAD